MKHKHHIIPRHAGGTDDESNLVELSIEEHAEAHRLLYEKRGCIEDLLAWKGLAGIASQEEIIQQLLSVAGKRGGPIGGKKAVETHKANKTGLWSEDHYLQKLGSKVGAALGGKAGSKTMIDQKIGIFGYSDEEKSRVSALGGKKAGSKNGAKLKENAKGIFNPTVHKAASAKGGKAQKGFKKFAHPNGDWKMAMPDSLKSAELIAAGYFQKKA